MHAQALHGCRGRRAFLAIGLCFLLPGITQADESPQLRLGQPGYLVITGARDSTRGFSIQTGPGPNRFSLVWSEGVISLPDSLQFEVFGESDFGVPCLADLSGAGKGGKLEFRDGIFKISEPLVLSDGIVEFHASGGELEIRGPRLRYRSEFEPKSDARAGTLLFLGVLILVVVLLRRARMHSGSRT